MSIAYARASAEWKILQECCGTVLSGKMPADDFLTELFRQEKRFGSSDRRRIRDTVFAFFRWLGPAEKASGTKAPSLENMLITLAAENLIVRNLEGYASLANLSAEALAGAQQAEMPLDRAAQTALLFGLSTSLNPEDVFPAWTRPFCTPEFMMTFQTKTPVWLRSELPDLDKRLAVHGIELIRHPQLPQAWKCLPFKGNLYRLPEYGDGLFEVQDFSSQCIGLAAQAHAGESWWDVCAGAGGKTLQLASQMHGSGSILATDISSGRLAPLLPRAERTGTNIIRTGVLDTAAVPVPEKMSGKFDGVLIDAPCSATGRWRRNPEARWTCTPETVQRCVSLQEKILEHASRAVRPGGYLIYGTCSFLPEENENQIQKFLLLHFDFELDEIGCILSEDKNNGMLRIDPRDADCDASFAARLHRKKNDSVVSMPQTTV